MKNKDIEINIDFIKSTIEEMQSDFFNNELFAYMALNGGYELPFQSNLGKKIQDKLGENYWVHTNKNKIDILIKDLKNNTFIAAIEVGHYQLQQKYSSNSKIQSDIFKKKEKFMCQVFHIFLLTDIGLETRTNDSITKYGSIRKVSLDEYSKAYGQIEGNNKVIQGHPFSYFGFKINYSIFVSGPFATDKKID
ncbi:MAG: hypothetical protein HXX16_20740 [Bacteroidales bacterium]|nr:hypothetical protein [Bacteroidales bacterium]